MASFFSYFNPIPQFPSHTGPHTVGTTDVEVSASSLPQTVHKPDSAVSTIAFRLYYPCQTPSTEVQSKSQSKPVRWISAPQVQYLASIFRFLGLSASLSGWLARGLPHLPRVSLPAHRDAPVARLQSGNEKKWPVFIFSHGLGGSRNAYSYICGCLASHGIIVAAPDHRDGSQSVAFVRGTEETEAQQVQYRVFSHKPGPDTYGGRDDQLKIRTWEICMLLEALASLDRGIQPLRDLHESSKDADRVLEQFKNQLDLEPGAVTYAGHSFGATTIIQLVKSAYYRRTAGIQAGFFKPTPRSPAIIDQITERSPVILLDPWGLPLTSPFFTQLASLPMPSYHDARATPALLVIMSQNFYDWRNNREQVLSALSPPSDYIDEAYQPEVFYPVTSGHLSQSDFGILFPRLTKYLAKAGEPRRLIDLNVRAILELLRRRGIKVEPFDLEKAGEAEEDEDWVDLGENAPRGDPRILSHEADAVKGWRYVPLGSDFPRTSKDEIKTEPFKETDEHAKEELEMEGLIDSGKA